MAGAAPEPKVVFLLAEVRSGLTFATLAREAGESEKRERNRHHAQRAVQTIERFLPTLFAAEAANVPDIQAGLQRLKRAVAAIPQ